MFPGYSYNSELESRIGLGTISAELDGFFRKPTIDSPIAAEPSISEEEHSTEELDVEIAVLDPTDRADDLWLLDDAPEIVPQYKSWDGFHAGEAAETTPLGITEAGLEVYDAMITWQMDPLAFGNQDHKVVHTRVYISSLLTLATGRESILFSWNSNTKSFRPTLPHMRISGHSTAVLQGIQDSAMGAGTMYRRLSKFVESTYNKHHSRSRVALGSTLDGVLAAVQTSVAITGPRIRSPLQLQSRLRKIHAILSHFDALMIQLRPTYGDEKILALVFRQTQAAEHNEPYLRDALREVLRRVSRPWVDFLEEWIGIRPEKGIRLTKNNVGMAKWFIRVESETYVDDFGQEAEEIDFRLDRSKLPDFVPEDVATSIFETGRNLRFIQDSHPDHLLADQRNISHCDPPRANWLYDWNSILDLEERVLEYRTALEDAISQAKAAKEDRKLEHVEIDPRFNTLQVFGASAAQIENGILASIRELSQPLGQTDTADRLREIIGFGLSDDGQEAVDPAAEFSPHWSLLPALSFGPIVSAQGSIVNQESTRLLFSSHDLRGHFQLQRQFHLFGNGMFCSRLSHALLDPDLETAERQAGVARQGGVMGLRLSGRENWPPASSELRLALMGVLAESFDQHGSNSGSSSKTQSLNELPGDLSFAVRDMPPEDVEKCLDPDSLEALDFLRLSYKPPPALVSIFTPVILMQYDRIFKLMLRVLRLVYVTNQIFGDLNRRTSHWAFPNDIVVRFGFEAQRFVASLSAYFGDVGISAPWKAFEGWLDGVQKDLELASQPSSGVIHSPERLRACHSLILDRIILALLLRKRQQPVLKLLGEIFETILQFAKICRNPTGNESPDIGRLYQLFRKKVEVFITVCKGLSEKGEFGLKADGNADVIHDVKDSLGGKLEENTINQLLMKLDMFNYYGKVHM